MQNFVQLGEQLDFTAPSDLVSGQPVVVGSLFGVSTTNVPNGQIGVLRLVGVVRLPKANGAITQFQKVFWDDTAKAVTTTAASNRAIGAATRPQAAGDVTVEVRLNGLAL